MGDLSWWHWLIVVLVFVLLFGSKRLPDAARALGKSMRILKTEVKGLHDDDNEADPAPPAAALPPATPPVAPPPAAQSPVTQSPVTQSPVAPPETSTPVSDSSDAR